MTSAQHPNRVYFSSLDRSPVDSNTDFTISFDTPIENAKNFEVVTASFPNTFHQFAPYETILYFYHEDFFDGTIAIAIPMSITLFAEGGATGENPIPSLRPAGRQEYIDGRYFLDGEDLQDYLNDWIQSLSVSWPTQASGLRPFYHPNDDPTAPIVYVADEVSSGITFSNLSFDYDTTTSAGGRGSLKFTFSDSGTLIVRIASIVDYGILRTDWKYPSQLGYKMGFTTLEQQAFNSVVNITSSNNQFTANSIYQYIETTTANNTFVIKYTTSAGVVKNDTITITDQGTPDFPLTKMDNYMGICFGKSVRNSGLPNIGMLQLPTATGTGGNTTYNMVWQFVDCQIGSSVVVNFSTNSTLNTILGVSAGDITLGTITSSTTNISYTTGNVAYNNTTIVPNLITISSSPIDYTASGLASRINTLLSAIDGFADFTMTASSLQLVGTLDNIDNPYSIYKGISISFDGSAVQQACKTAIGFTSNTNQLLYVYGSPATFTAPNNINSEGLPVDEEDIAEDPINLIRTSTIYFASSLSGGEALSSAGRKDILFAVPLTAPVGSVQLYQSTLSGVVVNRPPDVLRNLRVTLLDDNFQTMEAMPQNSSISVEVHFAYQDENQTNNISTIRTY